MKTLAWVLSIVATLFTVYLLFIAGYIVTRQHGSFLHLAHISPTILAVFALDVACIAIWRLIRRGAPQPSV